MGSSCRAGWPCFRHTCSGIASSLLNTINMDANLDSPQLFLDSLIRTTI